MINQVDQVKQMEKELFELENYIMDLWQFYPTPLAYLGLNGIVIDLDSSLAVLLGLPKEEIVGHHFSNFSLQAEEILKIQKETLEKGFIKDRDIAIKNKEGKEIPINISTTVRKNEEGNIIGYFVSLTDITERKKVEENLKHFKSAVEFSSDAIGMSTPEGKHIYQNKTFDKIFGDIGSDPTKTVYVDEKVGQEVFRTIMAGNEWAGEVEMYGKDKKVLSFLLRAYPIKDNNGKTIGLVGVHTDITERKRAEEQTRERMKELQTLFGLSELIEREGATLDELCQELANILPLGWLHAEIACARIVINDSEFRTKNFAETKWMQSAPVKVNKKATGWIEVGYLEERPARDEGPFLKEERRLIDSIAERLGRIIERTNAEKMLQDSEERFRIIYESSRDAVMTLEPPDWRFTSGNSSTIAMFLAKDEADFTSRGPWELSPERQPDGRLSLEKAKEMIEKAVKEGSNFFEWVHKRLSGEDFPATVLLTRFMLKGKTVLQATVRDITESKLAEKKLAESEERWRSLVAYAPNIIMMTDTEGKISFMNKPFPGFLMENIVGKLMYDFIAPEHHNLVKEINGNVISTAEASEYQVGGIGPKGQRLWYEIYVGPLLINGKVAALTYIMTDITERKWIEEEVGRYATELKRSNEDLQQFAYVASHDLQEPLRTIVSFIGMLERRYKGKLDAEADEFISFITNGAARMQQLILDLLAFSRVQTKGKELISTDTSKVLAQALENLGASLESNKAIITNDELPKVLGDESQLIQLFQNLIGNAIKFHGKEPPHVHVSAKQKGDYFVFSFRDNGIGIDPQYFDKLFQVFQRLHTKEEYPGTGIGLAVCKRIVGRHGGIIWVESKPGEGATFNFSLKSA